MEEAEPLAKSLSLVLAPGIPALLDGEDLDLVVAHPWTSYASLTLSRSLLVKNRLTEAMTRYPC